MVARGVLEHREGACKPHAVKMRKVVVYLPNGEEFFSSEIKEGSKAKLEGGTLTYDDEGGRQTFAGFPVHVEWDRPTRNVGDDSSEDND
jgi:hypothetical protein